MLKQLHKNRAVRNSFWIGPSGRVPVPPCPSPPLLASASFSPFLPFLYLPNYSPPNPLSLASWDSLPLWQALATLNNLFGITGAHRRVLVRFRH